MNHYIYIHLDPRKPGTFTYHDLIFGYEPYYVGVSKNSNRFSDHEREARHFIRTGDKPKRNPHKVYRIVDILKSGANSNILIFKDKLSETEAYLLEVELINKIGRVNMDTGPLLNVLSGGQVNNGILVSIALRKNAKLNQHRARIVIQCDLEGKEIKEWPSVSSIEQELHIGHTDACCRGLRKNAGGYKWKYKEDKPFYKEKYNKRKTNNVKNRRAVVQYSIDNKIIAEFNTCSEAERITGINRGTITQNAKNMINMAGGYIWKFKNNELV